MSSAGDWRTLGQGRTIELLRRSLSRGKLSHAYLFVGPKGVGKMTLALDLARAVNCESGEPPCGTCRSCERIASGKHADVRVVSLSSVEGAAKGRRRTEIGRDDIKDVIGMANLPPYEGKAKVFIVDGAERMSVEAANTLLKTLEEPPQKVLFTLLSSHEQALLPTVVSRCQRIELRPMPVEAVRGLLKERGVPVERAELLARLSSGCPGWALTASGGEAELEQRKRALAMLLQLPAADIKNRLDMADDLARRFEQGRGEIESLLGLWLGWCRDVLVLKAGCGATATNVDYQQELEKWAGSLDMDELVRAAESIRQAAEHLSLNVNPRLALEYLILGIPRKIIPTPGASAPAG